MGGSMPPYHGFCIEHTEVMVEQTVLDPSVSFQCCPLCLVAACARLYARSGELASDPTDDVLAGSKIASKAFY